MSSRLWAVAPVLIALTTAPVLGQKQPTPDKVVKLTADAAKSPIPALRYQLLPDASEMQPGNAVFGYYWAFSAEFMSLYRLKETTEKLKGWLELPIDNLPVEELKPYVNTLALQAVDRATRMEGCDWMMATRLRAEGLGTRLPEMQTLREFAHWLSFRAMIEIREKRFDDAAATIKTLFTMARHLDQHPTLICHLIGVAIANTALNRLDDWIAQPSAPNLYWALTALPAPLLEGWKGFHGERWFVRLDLGPSDQELVPWDEARQKDATGRLIKFLGYDPNGRNAAAARQATQKWTDHMNDPAAQQVARNQLMEMGVPANTAGMLPGPQAVLVATARRLDSLRDDMLKWQSLPYWELVGPMKEADVKFGEWFASLPDAGIWAKDDFDLQRGPMVKARLLQRIALLRHVEAVRLHAAANDGKLPAKLDAVGVPLPVDPVSGKPFDYQLDKETAYLLGKPAGQTVRYEVQIRK
jgi:hypothetical protein